MTFNLHIAALDENMQEIEHPANADLAWNGIEGIIRTLRDSIEFMKPGDALDISIEKSDR